MSIKEQLDDAVFLASNNRFMGSLTILLAAVGATSRKKYPQGTKSFRNPSDKMRDEEAYTRFLGSELGRMLWGMHGENADSRSIAVYKGKKYFIEYLLYKYYRCELIHEGRLPVDVEIDTSSELSEPLFSDRIKAKWLGGDKLILDLGWINVLYQIVRRAKCNGELFGIKYYSLIPKLGIDLSAYKMDSLKQFEIDAGKFEILNEAVELISPKVAKTESDDKVCELFLNQVRNGRINGSAITGLKFNELSDFSGNLTNKGLLVIRHIAEAYEDN